MIPAPNTFNKIKLALVHVLYFFSHALKIGLYEWNFYLRSVYANSVTNMSLQLSVVLVGILDVVSVRKLTEKNLLLWLVFL